MSDAINPDHYNKAKGTQITAFITEADLPYWQGSMIKYAYRAGRKVPEGKTPDEAALQDLAKAEWFLNFGMEQLRARVLAAGGTIPITPAMREQARRDDRLAEHIASLPEKSAA
jgi:hypothetical protein